MNRLRCGPLAAWAAAWLRGEAAYDDVLAAASVGANAGALTMALPRLPADPGAPGRTDGQLAPLGEVLIGWRHARAEVRLLLPIPGDVRGVPGPSSFRTAALDSGQAVIGGGVGVVPELIDHWPSSAPPTLQWRRFDIEAPMADIAPLVDAQHELTEAIRECASALAQIPLTTGAARDGRGEINDELAAARRAGERINLPPGFPPKAVSLIAQAERMAAVLALAEIDPASRPDGRSAVLAPLVTAVRRARLAGYNATL